MYIPPQYREEDPEAIRGFIRDNAFAILTSNGSEHPWATHLPLELQPDSGGPLVLEGHFAKANPQWRHLSDGDPVLCIFNGPHAYVSSSWYREEEVPTWNYMAVHLTGTWYRQTEEELRQSLERLVDRYEAASEKPVSMDRMSDDTLRQIRGIVGFRVEASRLEAAFKLSQGREEDHGRIRSKLQQRGGLAAEVARRMGKEKP